MRTLDNAYALVIGVDCDQKTPQPERDAKAIYNVLCDQSLCGYKEENVRLLADKEATMQRILDELDDIIKKTDEKSSFLLYYSGHGGYSKQYNLSYLCPYDYGNDQSKHVTGKELREKISEMKSKRIFILFDCCHSGAFFEEKKDEIISQTISNNTRQQIIRENSTLEGLAQEIDDEQGMVIVASSQADEQSWGDFENDDYSVFTTCLMEAFKAENIKHKKYLPDEYIRTVNTINYVFERTPELINILKKRSDIVKDQTPYSNLQMSSDFAICYIPEELKHKIATNKFQKPSQNTETVISKNSNIELWERDEGNNLLLFVPGFSGESKGTFGDIPKLLQADSNFDGWAMKSLGYSSGVQPKLGKDIWGAIRDLDIIAGNLRTSIKNKFRNYDRIAIVAHSLGGLVAQKAILGLDQDNRNRISHLIMFGTPSNGIAPEVLTKQWNKKYSDMNSEGDYIKSLRKKWKDTFNDNYPFKLKVAASTEDEYVTLESCHGPFNEEYREYVDDKHLAMVKPKDEKDDAYSLILNTLTGSKFFNQYANKEEINLTLGKYDAVVKELLPRKDDLDPRGLTQLIFALEGLERKDDITDILNSHPITQDVKKHTDLMGITAGRHKRDYLKTFSYKSSQLSRDYYSKALEISVENEVHSQIYYHAINLAFLSIVTDPVTGKSEMKKYANQALEATSHCDDDLWKFATVAEANMYLGHLETAKEYYIKASEGIGVREKISMHTNAYEGYVALTKKEDDEFTQFLKARLLS
ncbi:PGAP1-like protein [Formosa sp. Hel1_31_208]|uniref:caspase family protein n=1 Tax=Formosa sp. Hel1_31_208 TaxID=1798225 RepID=UPI00087B04D3|nr:caspase family protein [Formosa sp. Hel1_31_208]SDS56452.1 PGAP1-like protein [Formosa sp. Hel1_31_208]